MKSLAIASLLVGRLQARQYTTIYEDDDYNGPKGSGGQQQLLYQAEREAIVNRHNYWRNEAALGNLKQGKKATKMQKLQWDTELEKSAEAYALQCSFAHSMYNGFRVLPYDIGENLYAVGQSHSVNPANGMDAWMNEIDYYNHEDNTCQEGKGCGHYKQTIWDDTQRVGCSKAKCDSIAGLPWTNGGTYIVCHYYPQGNYYGIWPYSFNDALEEQNGEDSTIGMECPNGKMDTEYPGLCDNSDNSVCSPDRCEHNGVCYQEFSDSIYRPYSVKESEYKCDCFNINKGRWCQNTKCEVHSLEGFTIRSSHRFKTNSGNSLLYYAEWDEKGAWAMCEKINLGLTQYTEDCKGIVKHYHAGHDLTGSYYFYYIGFNIAEGEGQQHHENSIIYWRDCSNINDPYANPPNGAYQSTAPQMTTTPGPTTVTEQTSQESTTIQELTLQHSVKIDLTDEFGKIRLGGSYANDDNDECMSLAPYTKAGVAKPWHYNSRVIREPCNDVNAELLYEGDHQAWIYKPNQGTICTGYRTKNMENKKFRYCLSSNYQQGGKREVKLKELKDSVKGSDIPYNFQFEFKNGQIEGRHQEPVEVFTYDQKSNYFYVRPVKLESFFGSASVKSKLV